MNNHLYARALWNAKLARQITATEYLIGRVLLRRTDRHWRCWPALATLARDVGCCVRTVSRAVDSLKALGLLQVQRRRSAWNRMAPNLYLLMLPDQQVAPLKRRESSLKSSVALLSNGWERVEEAARANVARQLALLGFAPTSDTKRGAEAPLSRAV